MVEASAQAGADVSQSVDSEVVNTAIQNVLETQQQAWNAGDIDKFMEFYWKSDNLTFSSGGKITRGWQSTLENYKTRYPSVAEMGQLTFGDLQITLLGSDAALVLGEWHLSRESQGVEDVGGKFSLVLRRIDDQWLIIHDHTSRSEQP